MSDYVGLDEIRQQPQVGESPAWGHALLEQVVTKSFDEDEYEPQHCHAESETDVFHPHVGEDQFRVAVQAELGLFWAGDSRAVEAVDRVCDDLETVPEEAHGHGEGYEEGLLQAPTSVVVDGKDHQRGYDGGAEEHSVLERKTRN